MWGAVAIFSGKHMFSFLLVILLDSIKKHLEFVIRTSRKEIGMHLTVFSFNNLFYEVFFLYSVTRTVILCDQSNE
jgi:hypothetical protein